MRRNWLFALLMVLMTLNVSCSAQNASTMESALTKLTNSKTVAEEQLAAEALMQVVHAQRHVLNISVYDAQTKAAIPINALGNAKGIQTVYVEIAMDRGVRPQQWFPKDIQHVFILLRE